MYSSKRSNPYFFLTCSKISSLLKTWFAGFPSILARPKIKSSVIFFNIGTFFFASLKIIRTASSLLIGLKFLSGKGGKTLRGGFGGGVGAGGSGVSGGSGSCGRFFFLLREGTPNLQSLPQSAKGISFSSCAKSPSKVYMKNLICLNLIVSKIFSQVTSSFVKPKRITALSSQSESTSSSSSILNFAKIYDHFEPSNVKEINQTT